MDLPDIQALKHGDSSEWDRAFKWLWPTAFHVSRNQLERFLPEDVEDVAIEALEEIVEKVVDLERIEELKPLLACIAHHRAVTRLRQHFSQKRGSGQTQSLDELNQDEVSEIMGGTSPLANIERKELAQMLGRLLDELKPPQGEILADFFNHHLSYEELSKKHGLAIGSIGVYLKRGLEALKSAWQKVAK